MKRRNLLNMNTAQLLEVYREDLPGLVEIAEKSRKYTEFEQLLKNWVHEKAYGLYGRQTELSLPIADVPAYSAARRVFRTLLFPDGEVKDRASEEVIEGKTFFWLWKALTGETENITPDFLIDLYYLFVQLEVSFYPVYQQEDLVKDMARWPTGIDDSVFYERSGNRMLIINCLVEKIEQQPRSLYHFSEEMTYTEKQELVNFWWYDFRFQLVMAVRNPRELNHFLGGTLSVKTMKILNEAEQKGIPFFVTPYYLSLLSVKPKGYDDEAIRCYVLYSKELVENFGNIRAWEKEDEVKPGAPNVAGWLVPGQNIHRRYPEVAIFIPEARGRACGGLCALCQRMYAFQQGNLNFDLERLSPDESWSDKLNRWMTYFEQDSQLKDILVTGGDALMNHNKTLEKILEGIYQMAQRKKEANRERKEGEKYAEIERVRLGSRLLAYLPFRVNDDLARILKSFREKALKIGIRQFVIQTHFESPLEVTVEVRTAVHKLLAAGWLVVNQQVFTAAASRRGHTARLRQVLNRVGIVTYYTFSVKGFQENYALYAPLCRSIQEQKEEKAAGILGPEMSNTLAKTMEEPAYLRYFFARMTNRYRLPFLATDRSVMNLPGIGKSMTFATVGLNRDGKRIVCFTLDPTRFHSPALQKEEKIYIVENKSVAAYLRQLKKMGENPADYESLWYYQEGNTEARFQAYEYPGRQQGITSFFTNLAV